MNEWSKPEHVQAYLAHADSIPHRQEGEEALLYWVPPTTQRILDLGTGDGRLAELLLKRCPQAEVVAVDLSESMLELAQRRFAGESRVTLLQHDFNQPLPQLGTFEVVASSFAIHHCEDERKQSLYEEVFELLSPGGLFVNLEHVTSPSLELHARFYGLMGIELKDEDPMNRLAPVESQLRWLRNSGFQEVDCYWKWWELALLIGSKR